MWEVVLTDQGVRDIKTYDKKHPNELAAVMRNLDRYLSQLNCAKNSRAVQGGYLHAEQGGVVAVDQKGGSKIKLAQTRLYTFCDDAEKKVYIICIGNKSTQPSDVRFAKGFIEKHTIKDQEND